MNLLSAGLAMYLRGANAQAMGDNGTIISRKEDHQSRTAKRWCRDWALHSAR
jgi:hypothetical protein